MTRTTISFTHEQIAEARARIGYWLSSAAIVARIRSASRTNCETVVPWRLADSATVASRPPSIHDEARHTSDVNRSRTDDLAWWLAPTDLRSAVVPASLVGLVRAVAAARPEELSRNDPVPDTAAERQAAVLILIATDRDDGPDVLLQQRAPNLRDHASEIAFPGGAREDGDAGPPATAIREAAEETGVDPAGVEPLIVLPRLHIPPSRFDVTGVLAHWRSPSPVSAIDPDETNRVMRVPFSALADPGNRIMLRTSFGWRGPAFVLDGAVVWGYTGEILAALLRLGGWERPWVASDPVDLDQARRRAR